MASLQKKSTHDAAWNITAAAAAAVASASCPT